MRAWRRTVLAAVAGGALAAGCGNPGSGQDQSSRAKRSYGATSTTQEQNRDYTQSESNMGPESVAMGGSGSSAAMDVELGAGMAQTYKGRAADGGAMMRPDAGMTDAGTMMRPDAGTTRDAGTMMRPEGDTMRTRPDAGTLMRPDAGMRR